MGVSKLQLNPHLYRLVVRETTPSSMAASHFNPFITRRQILDSSKLKEYADDNFKFDENVRKLSKREENTVGKGEIARYEQFLLFP